MSATISIETVLPDGTPASGSDISFQNESAKFKDAINWSGTADRSGICVWKDMDTGILGDMYFFKASYVDPKNGTTFVGEKKVRIKKDQVVKLNLRTAYLGEVFQLRISEEDLKRISHLHGGEEILSVIKELSIATQYRLSHAAVMLESYIVESFIRIRLIQQEHWKEDFERFTLGQLLEEQDIKELLKPNVLRRVKILNELRRAAVHSIDIGSYIEEAALGLSLIKELIKEWFRIG